MIQQTGYEKVGEGTGVNIQCTKCPAGSYSVNGATCIPCASATYTAPRTEGATECKACPYSATGQLEGVVQWPETSGDIFTACAWECTGEWEKRNDDSPGCLTCEGTEICDSGYYVTQCGLQNAEPPVDAVSHDLKKCNE